MSAAGSDPLDALAEEYLRQYRAGGRVGVEAFADSHPEHRQELLEILPAMVALEQWKRDRESTASSGRALQVPPLERLGDYRILREVGRGGMGVVFEAEQQSLGRRVALKVLPAQALSSPRQLHRFQREAQTAARLHHSNIVPVFGSGHTDGFHYYAMQFIDGRGLDRVAEEWAGARRQRPAEGQRQAHLLARLGGQAAAALQHAHDHGVLHRDIKPSNLLLDATDNVWVADFGLAKALESEGLTNSGDVLGTLQYMAPEQFSGAYDVRSEVYGLGLTLYELLAGEPAFRSGNRGELIDRIRQGRIEPLSRRRPDLPRDLVTVIEKAVRSDPELRYQSAREFGEDLERFLQDRPILARPVSSAEHLWRFCRRNRALAVLGAATATAVLGIAILGWTLYVSAESARVRIEKISRQERESSSRAETNLGLAMRAFEDVFDSIVGPDPFHSIGEDPDTGDYEATVRAPVGQRDLQLLERMLQFYGRFAAANVDNIALREQAARAYRRVGTIHGRLGDLPAAELAFGKALELHRSQTGVGSRIDLAALHLELGQVLLWGGRGGDAVDQLRTGLRVLEGEIPDITARARFERARGHLLLATALEQRNRFGRRGGEGPGRDGPRPDGQRPEGPRPDSREEVREQTQKARALIESLLADEAGNPDALLLQARLLVMEGRQRRPGTPQPAVQDDPTRQAIAVLEGLVGRFPTAEQYRFELAELYGLLLDFRRWRGGGQGGPGGERSSPTAADVADARACVRHAEALVEQAPASREYIGLLGRARNRLGAMLLRGRDPAAAETELRQALQTWQRLLPREGSATASEPRELAQAAVAQALLARSLWDRDDREAARQQAEAALQRIQQALLAARSAAERTAGERPGPGPERMPWSRQVAGAAFELVALLDDLGLGERFEQFRRELPRPERRGR